MNATEFAGVYYCTRHAGICNEDSDKCDFAGSNPKDPTYGDTETCISCDQPIEYTNNTNYDLWVHTATKLETCDADDPGGVYAEPTDACILHACYYDLAVIRK